MFQQDLNNSIVTENGLQCGALSNLISSARKWLAM